MAPIAAMLRTLSPAGEGQLGKNMAAGVVAMGLNVALVLISYPVYLRYLGLERYGVWLVLSTVLTFAQLGNLGVAQAVTKFVAEEHARDDVAAIESYVRAALLLLAGAGAITALGVSLARAPIAASFKLTAEAAAVVTWLVPWVAALSAYVMLTQVSSGVLAGLGRMDQANYIQVAGRAGALAASWAGLRAGWGVESLLLGNFASTAVVHAWTALAVRRILVLRPLRRGRPDRARLRKLVGFGTGVFGSALLGLLLHPLNRLLLSRYAGVQTLPILEIAFTGAAHVRSLFESALRALMPEFSRAAALGSRDEMAALGRKAAIVLWGAGAPAYAALAAVAPLALPLWLGASFVPLQVPVFEVMLAGSFLSLLGVPAYYYFLGTGAVRVGFNAHVVQSGVSAVLVLGAVLLTSRLGVLWTATSVGAGFGLGTLYLVSMRHVDERSRRSCS